MPESSSIPVVIPSRYGAQASRGIPPVADSTPVRPAADPVPRRVPLPRPPAASPPPPPPPRFRRRVHGMLPTARACSREEPVRSTRSVHSARGNAGDALHPHPSPPRPSDRDPRRLASRFRRPVHGMLPSARLTCAKKPCTSTRSRAFGEGGSARGGEGARGRGGQRRPTWRTVRTTRPATRAQNAALTPKTAMPDAADQEGHRPRGCARPDRRWPAVRMTRTRRTVRGRRPRGSRRRGASTTRAAKAAENAPSTRYETPVETPATQRRFGSGRHPVRRPGAALIAARFDGMTRPPSPRARCRGR